MTDDDLAGRRILVVEDETIIAISIENDLQALGCEVVGPVAKLELALRLAQHEALDAAVLDVTIRGGNVYPVAEQLLVRGVPFALASGYSDWALPDNLQALPRLTKPFTKRELEDQVRSLIQGAALRPRTPPR
ncbi:response regulator [Roseomonas terrae]|uniref:Response regulator n=1 Tax=Neoroseomonas terrae TaxID=424799 RepID=A0ABS5ECG9_9PROT|nr:response regulator [Neoroseomonas terrae]MBR0648724.1 response regulator [Neoroseomonas terrae]